MVLREVVDRILLPQLVALAERSRLYDGGNIGVLTGYTVPLETLTLQGNYGHVVVLVTSGNRSFEQHPARKELLALLRRMEHRMGTRALRTYWRSRSSDRDE